MRIIKIIAMFVISMLLICLEPTDMVMAYIDIDQNRTFIFTHDAVDITIPNAYQLEQIVQLTDNEEKNINDARDIFVFDNRIIYVLDKSGGRIIVYNADFQQTKIIDQFTLPDGSADQLQQPEGIYVSADQKIYVADTQNERILKMDSLGNIELVVDKPDYFQGIDIESFYPIKIVADPVGRMIVIARNINMGLLQFDGEGNFIGYFGAPKVRVNIITRMWKMISTQEQRSRMEQFVPTEYSNINIDPAGFIYGTISSISQADVQSMIGRRGGNIDVTPIKKLNSMGEDVLKRNGLTAPLGNLNLTQPNSASRIIDVALGPSGSYTMLDGAFGTLYTYSDEGILLHAFGGLGKNKLSFEQPLAVEYIGDKLIVMDALMSQLSVFSPTYYGSVVLDAIRSEYDGDFETAYQRWGEITEMNSNFSYAFTGLGRIRYESGEYREAMRYFQFARDNRNYSKAKEKLRYEIMVGLFPYLFITFLSLAFLGLIISIYSRIRRYFTERIL